MKVLSRCNADANLGILKHKVEKWVNNTGYLGYISRWIGISIDFQASLSELMSI